jgi:hypothetical protein
MQNGNSITKADLKAALSELRSETKADLKVALAELRIETKADRASAITDLRNEMTDTMRQIETNLLTEFHRYGKGQQIRLHSLESRDAGVIERLAVIEERLLHLESRRPPSI